MATPEISDAERLAFRLNGADMVAHLSGALYWPAERTLAVADLHLEKGSGFARRGSLLPPYDTDATLARLAEAIGRFRPERVICLGDSFHDQEAVDRLPESAGARLRALAARHDWIWVCGNHDPAPPTGWGGRIVETLALGPLQFRHQAVRGPVAGEVSGHFHPKAGLSVRGRRLSGRCFVGDGRRLILPAFGAYAGGLDLRDPAIATLFDGRCQVYLLGRAKLHRFSAAQFAA